MKQGNDIGPYSLKKKVTIYLLIQTLPISLVRA